MKRMHVISVLSMVLIYMITSELVNQPFILPRLSEIGHSFFNIISNSSFPFIIFMTFSRFLEGFIFSFMIALLIASLAFYSKKFAEFFEPIYLLLKSIPNITYIIISLIWLGREKSIILVVFLAIFPLIYNSIYETFQGIDANIIKVTRVYNHSFLFKLRSIYLPMIRSEIFIAIKNSLALAFKVAIMAEILGQVKNGIGHELNFYRFNYLMSDIFAWTIIIVLITTFNDYLFSKIAKKLKF